MSYDVFVQGFENGDARDADAAAVEAVLAPYVVERDDGGWVRLRVGNDDSDLYGFDDLRNGFSVTHTGRAVFDVVVAAAKAGDLVILPQDGPPAIVHEGQRPHLPPELAELGPVLVASGDDLVRLIESC